MVLAVGFALADTGAGRALGDAVATGLAGLAAPLLRMLEPGLQQIGTELRSPEGWAVRVSEVCDGHGLVISLAAGLAALAPGWQSGLVRLAVGLVAIQFFNLVRIVALAVTLDGAPAAFDLVHAGVFPYLTVALLALCLLPLRPAVGLVALALPLALLWLPFADTLAAVFVPAANLVLSLLAGPEIGELALRTAGWTVGTNLLASPEGEAVRRFLAPLRPADFALAVPVLLAAVLLARRPLWLAGAILAILAALCIAAVATVWTLAEARAPATVLLPDGAGGLVAQPFAPPQTGVTLLRLLQSVLVHLNLLVLPMLILAKGGSRD
ncbi:hypothetical protein [Tabrizicola aquatica]|uniref:hypothetical protein n=1 Tax=Tabrizicola aquatica TaxID=909926 RepID=UPI000CD2F8DA|nr:hypothetical protein [Tabrizicola aquatica]